MTQKIKKDILELMQGKKMKTVLIIDEASLCGWRSWRRFTLSVRSIRMPSCPSSSPAIQPRRQTDVPIIPLPLASRIVARSHLEGVHREGMEAYITHHLAIAGIKTNPFDETAVTAIHQGSGGSSERQTIWPEVRSSPPLRINP